MRLAVLLVGFLIAYKPEIDNFGVIGLALLSFFFFWMDLAELGIKNTKKGG